MGQDSKIEWTRHTANLWWGCEEVHSGCDHCYARILARSKGKATAWQGTRFAVAGIWDNLLKWQRAAEKAVEIHRVFCGSMMDIFEKSRPASDWSGRPLGITTGEIRDRFFREVVPATPNLLYLLLTKRPGNATKMVPPAWLDRWPPNVMTGASVVDQPTADTLIPQLLRVPGLRFVSYEPALGPVDFRFEEWEQDSYWEPPCKVLTLAGQGIDWVICGGESGPHARPMNPDWARSVRDQCLAAGIAYFFKQNGEFIHESQIPADFYRDRESRGIREHLWPDGSRSFRVGKKAAGRLLDGRTWDQFPAVATEARS